jgi:hypothetical protein
MATIGLQARTIGQLGAVMAEERSRVFGVVRGAVFTVAGLADMAHSEVSQALDVGGAQQRRNALPVPGGIQARGSRLVRRWTMPADHHLEVMARRVARAAKASDRES